MTSFWHFQHGNDQLLRTIGHESAPRPMPRITSPKAPTAYRRNPTNPQRVPFGSYRAPNRTQ
jgi:hypothetical protein